MFADYYANSKKSLNRSLNKIQDQSPSTSPSPSNPKNLNVTGSINLMKKDPGRLSSSQANNDNEANSNNNNNNSGPGGSGGGYSYQNISRKNRSKSPTVTEKKIPQKVTPNKKPTKILNDNITKQKEKNFKGKEKENGLNITPSHYHHHLKSTGDNNESPKFEGPRFGGESKKTGIAMAVDQKTNEKIQFKMDERLMTMTKIDKSPQEPDNLANNNKNSTNLTEDKGFNTERFRKFEDFWKSINEMKQGFYQRLNDQAIDISKQSPSKNPYVYKEKSSPNLNLLTCSIEDLVNKSFDNTKLDDQLNFSHHSFNGQESFLTNNNNNNNTRSKSNSPMKDHSQESRSKDQLDRILDKSKEFYTKLEKSELNSSYQKHSPTRYSELNHLNKSYFAQSQFLDVNDSLLKKSPYQQYHQPYQHHQHPNAENNSFQIIDGYIANPISSYSTFQNNTDNPLFTRGRGEGGGGGGHNLSPTKSITTDHDHDDFTYNPIGNSGRGGGIGRGSISTTRGRSIGDTHGGGNGNGTNGGGNGLNGLNGPNGGALLFTENNDGLSNLGNNSLTEFEYEILKYKKEFVRLEELIKEREDIIDILQRQLKEKVEDCMKEKSEREKELMKSRELSEESFKEKKRLEIALDQTMNKLQMLQQISIENGVQIDKLKKENKALEGSIQDKRLLERKIQEYEGSLRIQIELNAELKQRLSFIGLNKEQDISNQDLKYQEIIKNFSEENEALKNENLHLREGLIRFSAKDEDENLMLKSEYKKVTDNLTTLLKQLEANKLQNRELQEGISILRRENEQLIYNNTIEKGKLQENIDELVQENEKKSTQIRNMNDSLKQTKELNQAFMLDKNNNHEQVYQVIKELEDRLYDQIEKNKALQKKIDDSAKDYKSLEESYRKQKETMNLLTKSPAIAEFSSSQKITTDQQAVQLPLLKNENQQLKLDIQSLTNENKQIMDQFQQTKKDYLQVKNENSQLKAMVQQLKNENKSITNQNDNLQQSFENLRKINEIANIDKPKESQVQPQVNAKPLLPSTTLLASSSSNPNSQEMMNLKADVNRLKEKEQQMVVESSNLKNENEKLLSVNNELNMKIEALNQEILSLKKNIKDTESNQASTQKQITTLTTEIFKLKAENDQLSLALKNEQSKGYDKLKNENKDLTNQLEKYKTENKTQAKTMQEYDKKLKSSTNEIDNMKQTIAKISSKDKLAAAYDELKKEYDKYKDDMRIKIQKLEQKITEGEIYSVQNEQLKHIIEESETTINSLTASLNDLKSKLELYQQQGEGSRPNDPNQAMGLKNNTGNEEDKERIKELIEELEQQKKVFAQQKELLKKYQAVNKSQKSELEQLKESNETLQQQLKSQNSSTKK